MELILIAIYIMFLLLLLTIIGVTFLVLCEIGKQVEEIRRYIEKRDRRKRDE